MTDVSKVEVVNKGSTTRTFTVKPLNIGVRLKPNERHTVTVNASPGEYPYVCAIHPDMKRTMVVK